MVIDINFITLISQCFLFFFYQFIERFNTYFLNKKFDSCFMTTCSFTISIKNTQYTFYVRYQQILFKKFMSCYRQKRLRSQSSTYHYFKSSFLPVYLLYTGNSAEIMHECKSCIFFAA